MIVGLFPDDCGAFPGYRLQDVPFATGIFGAHCPKNQQLTIDIANLDNLYLWFCLLLLSTFSYHQYNTPESVYFLNAPAMPKILRCAHTMINSARFMQKMRSRSPLTGEYAPEALHDGALKNMIMILI
ncbi:hypothetical protein [Dickeya sp. NCPPB 3274]|uniref:hypothetical protein n=1 Tax=Dickeya sp. NCPPB 3274 TaxID=568766 RepID=UPI0005B4DA0F|nr:hypothetical protein [Dickeya sp. NCPPB 3274]